MKIRIETEKAQNSEALTDAAIRWQVASEHFDWASDDEVVDMSIFDMEAAKRRFVFLLKRNCEYDA